MTIESIGNIEGIYSRLKNPDQQGLFQFILEHQYIPFSESGFRKSLLQAQSFRDEKAAIVFPNNSSGYRVELNDNPTKEAMEPTLASTF